MNKLSVFAGLPETRRWIAGTVLVQLAGLVLNILMMFLVVGFLGQLVEGRADVGFFVVSMILLLLLQTMAVSRKSHMSHMASQSIKEHYREALFKKAYSMGLGYAAHMKQSELVQIAVEGIEQLDHFYGRFLPQLFYALISPLLLFAALSMVNWRAALFLFLLTPLIILVMMSVQRLARRVMGSYWQSYISLSERFLDNLRGLVTLKVYAADEESNRAMNEEASAFRIATMRVLRMQLANIIWMDLVAYGGAALGTALILWEYHAGRIDLAGVLLFILLAAEFFLPLRLLGSFFHVAMNGMSAMDRMLAILDLPDPEEGEGVIPAAPGALEISDLFFAYEAARPILQGVSVRAEAGRFIAIVGPSGCGKSTLAALIAGERRPNGGRIRYAGVEDPSPQSLAERVGKVDASPWLFTGTVRELLHMARPDAADHILWQVLDAVALKDHFKAADGLDTFIEEAGKNLSGGQRQRLGIARLLLKEAPIYIFDEATSNVDAESEERILRTYRRLSQRSLVLMITHRMANAMLADEVWVMEEGRLVGAGAPSVLYRENALFRALVDEQAAFETVSPAPAPERVRRPRWRITQRFMAPERTSERKVPL